MPPFLYTPLEEYYKTPFGPIPEGSSARLRVRVLRDRAAFSLYLSLAEDGKEAKPHPMKWLGLKDSYDEYEYTVDGLAPGLYWYWFTQDVFGDKTEFGREKPWQLTVYRADYLTPDWFDAGVTYHIFVDRFHRAGERPEPKQGRPFRLHESWGETPDLYPEGQLDQNFDFYGGNLKGIEEKLDYLESLGVTTIYLSPVFEAASNHRYDTGDYLKIDPVAGNEEDFTRLCDKAGERGIRVLMDGVFNHTGSDSRYFNAKGLYDSLGAAQSKDSPYIGWYCFGEWPGGYASWWGVKTLPQTNKSDASYIDFTLENDESVVKRWLRLGASGWRLDVADELPREYLERLRAAVKAEKPDAAIIGEVWEDASNKVSYGSRRRYLQGRELDGAINYPARDAILRFMKGELDTQALAEALLALHEHYPEPARRCSMNVLGTHDTPRILNVLGCGDEEFAKPKPEKAGHALTHAEICLGKARLKLASAMQYMLPGSPCLYYGDEAGMEGFEDPLNRRGYPWGMEDGELLEWYRALGTMRRHYRAIFQTGLFEVLPLSPDAFRVTRKVRGEAVVLVVNRSDDPFETEMEPGAVILAGTCESHSNCVKIGPISAVAWLQGSTSG